MNKVYMKTNIFLVSIIFLLLIMVGVLFLTSQISTPEFEESITQDDQQVTDLSADLDEIRKVLSEDREDIVEEAAKKFSPDDVDLSQFSFLPASYGNRLLVNGQQMIIIDEIVDANKGRVFRLLLEDNSYNNNRLADVIRLPDELLRDDYNKFNGGDVGLGTHPDGGPAYVTLWDLSDNLLHTASDYPKELFNVPNSFIKVDRILDNSTILLRRSIGDAGGFGEDFYKMDLSNGQSTKLYSEHIFYEPSPGLAQNDKPLEFYKHWNRTDPFRGGIGTIGQFKFMDGTFSDLFYEKETDDIFQRAEFSGTAHETDKEASVDFYSEFNLENYEAGLEFTIDSEQVFITWI